MADEKSRGRGAPGRGGWWFLATILLLLLIVRWLNPALGEASMARFVATLTDLFPLFGIMFLLLWMFNLFVRPGRVVEQVGHTSGTRGWVLAVGAGVLSMGPM